MGAIRFMAAFWQQARRLQAQLSARPRAKSLTSHNQGQP